MSLSPEDKERIEAEERARFAEEAEREKIRTQLQAEEEERDKKVQGQKKAKGCLRFFLIIFIIFVGVFGCIVILDDGSEAPTTTTGESSASQTSLQSKWGIENKTRATRICREFRNMLSGVSDGTENYNESRERMKKMDGLASSEIASSLRSPVNAMLSAWTQSDTERWLLATEALAPICADVSR